MNTIQKLSRKFAEQQSLTQFADLPFNSIADVHWIYNHSNLPWLKLMISVPYEIINEEIKNIENHFVLHRSDYSEHTDWQSFCIHGKSFDATREDDYYLDNRPHDWTPEAIKLMPQTVEYFKHWPRNKFFRIRVMKLAPAGIISIHRDAELPGKLGPINIAITQPLECKFVMENHGVVPFIKGSAFILNVSNRHTVVNDSDEYRYHIIVHQSNDAVFDKLVVESYNSYYAQ